MFKKIFFAISLLLISSSAFAQYSHRYSDRGYRAEIVEVNERRDFVTRYTHGQICNGWPVQDRQYGQYRDNRDNATTGAVVGAILGSAIGGGNGRVAATGVGAVIGAAVGSHRGDRYQDNYYYRRNDRCHYGEYQIRDEIIVGYDVTYRINGHYERIFTHERPQSRWIWVR